MIIPVDSSRFETTVTGKYVPAYKWEENDGKRYRSNVQETNSVNIPLWEVEFLIHEEYFGNQVTSVEKVIIPSSTAPNLKRFAPVQFKNLTLNVFSRRGGSMGKYWEAEGIFDEMSEFITED